MAATGPAGAGRTADAAYMSLREGRRTKTLRKIAEEAGFDVDAFLALDPGARSAARAQGKRNLADAVWAAARGIRTGSFPVAPRDCEYCEFRSACRVTALAEVENE
jgi:hypothetical protein